MKRLSTFLLFILLALPISARAEIISSIAAVVNDEVITTYDVEKAYLLALRDAEKRGTVSAETKKSLRDSMVQQLIDRKLVEQKIKELNIKVSEEEVRQGIDEVKRQNNLTQESLAAALRSQGMSFEQYKEQFREQLERIRIMGQEVRAKIQVGDKDIQEYYQANLAKFTEEPRFHARHIFFRMKKDASSEEVKQIMATAMNVLAEARSGKDFAALAKQYSNDPGAATDGGDLGTFKKGEMLPEIEGTVLAMQTGEVSDLVSTPAGFHIIKLEERIPGKVKSLAEVKADIEESLYKTRSEERFSQWLGELKKSASIEIKQK